MSDTRKKFNHINFEERKIIERLLKANTPKKQIARMLDRDISNIRDEIKRGSVEQRKKINTTKKDPSIPLYETKLVYFADVAQRNCDKAKSNSGRKCKLTECRDFLNFAEDKFYNEKWSLDVSVGFAKENELFDDICCTQTLYNWVDQNLCNIHNIDLPRKVKIKTHKKKIEKKHKRLFGTSIEERPDKINERSEFGHWEGDGIVGRNKKGFFITLVERKTRMGFLFNVGDKQSIRIVEVIDYLEEQFGKMFPKIFKTITFDNGTEFADCVNIEKFDRTKVYYAHPYSSWERGSNENWNGLVRRFVPKGTNFSTLQPGDVERIMNMINSMPRKIFHYRTAEDMFMREIDNLLEKSA